MNVTECLHSSFWVPIDFSSIYKLQHNKDVSTSQSDLGTLSASNNYTFHPKKLAEDIKFAEVPNGLSAFSKVPALGWLQIVGFAGIVELNATWYNTEIRS